MKRVILQNIEGMSRIGFISDLEIYVNTDDSGKIPHFHVRDSKDWKRFHTCIRIDAPEYFHHGSKQSTLNASQRKELDEFMKSPCSKKLYNESGRRLNNWERVCMLWDDNNSDVEIPDSVIQPDYTQLR